MQQKLKPSTSQPTHFQEVFRKCFHHVKENKGNIVKECGTDAESFQFFDQFSYPCVCIRMKISVMIFTAVFKQSGICIQPNICVFIDNTQMLRC